MKYNFSNITKGLFFSSITGSLFLFFMQLLFTKDASLEEFFFINESLGISLTNNLWFTFFVLFLFSIIMSTLFIVGYFVFNKLFIYRYTLLLAIIYFYILFIAPNIGIKNIFAIQLENEQKIILRFWWLGVVLMNSVAFLLFIYSQAIIVKIIAVLLMLVHYFIGSPSNFNYNEDLVGSYFVFVSILEWGKLIVYWLIIINIIHLVFRNRYIEETSKISMK